MARETENRKNHYWKGALSLNEQKNNKAQQHHCFISLQLRCFIEWCGESEKISPIPIRRRIKMQKPFSFIIAFPSSKHPRLGVSTFADLVINFICAVFSRSKSCQVTLSLSSYSALVRLGNGVGGGWRKFSCLFFQWFNLLIYYHAWVASRSGVGNGNIEKQERWHWTPTIVLWWKASREHSPTFSRAILDVINFHFCYIAAAKAGGGKTIPKKISVIRFNFILRH